MLSLFGSGIGRGIVIAKAYVLKSNDIEIPHYSIKNTHVKDEVQRLEEAIAKTEQQYLDSKKKLPKSAPPESAAFIEAYLLMLRDPLLAQESKKLIRKLKINAEQALSMQADNLIAIFAQMQDNYLRNKQEDVRQISNRILRNLLHLSSQSLEDLEQSDLQNHIIVSPELSPNEVILLKNYKATAFINDLGSQISHSSIVARSLQLPAVVGLHGSSRFINNGDLLIVDGKRGVILINPVDAVLKEYKKLQQKIRQREQQLKRLIDKPSKTLDKHKVNLFANIESYKEIKLVKQSNANGVGLYRTEYLFLDRDTPPSEHEQFLAYKKIITKLNKPITIRTLDVGGDKLPQFNYPQKASSLSPLGLRAIRLCLNDVNLFKPQLRAILRASAFGKVSILLPMLSSIDEVEQSLSLIQQVKRELKEQKKAFDSRIKIGGMIEVPAAAIMAEQFAKKLDFLSIGTNDLVQYTLAIDRVDDSVNYLYNPIHPSVLHLIQHVIRCANKANVPVSLCGEMAGNLRYTRLLLGLGLRNFSMDATYLLDVKEQILNADIQKFNYQVKQILKASNSSIANDHLSKLNAL